MNYNNPVANRFSNKEKQDEDWYREQISLLGIATNQRIDEFEALKLSCDIYGDDLEKLEQEFKAWCDPLGLNIRSYKPVPYPIIHNKINVLKGEMLKRADEYSIVSFSPSAALEKTKQLMNNLQSKISEQVQSLINAIKEGKTEEELSQITEAESQRITPEDIDLLNFKSEWEKFYEFALRMCTQLERVKDKKVESLQDLQTMGRFFVYSGWKNGKPKLELRNPLFLEFHKSGDEEYVNKADWIKYRKPRSMFDVYQDHAHKLDNDQKERVFGSYRAHGNYLSSSHSVIDRKTPSQAGYVHRKLDFNQSNFTDKHITEHKSSTRKYSGNSLIWETHIEFKHLEKIYFLSYEDELGNKVTIPITNKFKVPKDADKYLKENQFGVEVTAYTWIENEVQYDIEEIEIPVKHEVIILGDDVYVTYRKVPNQHIDVNDPYGSFNLSTYGTVISSRNIRSISPIQRILPLYMQYIYVKHKQNKEIAKYEGYIQNVDVDQIPTDLAQDEEGNIINDPVKVWLTYQSETGKNFYSGSQTKNNLPVPPTRAPGSSAQILGAAQEIFTLQNLLELIDAEIGMALGVPPQREAQFATNSNASDNRQALIQSYHITEPYFAKIDEVYRQATEDYIQNFRHWCKIQLEDNNTNIFSYVLPDGTQALFEVQPSMLSMDQMGLYLKSNSNRREYNDYMMSNIQAFAQNAGQGVEAVSDIIKGISSGQPLEETHRQIQIRNKQIKEQQQQQQQQIHKNQMELLEKQKELERQEHERELEKIKLKATIEGEYSLKEKQLTLNAKPTIQE